MPDRELASAHDREDRHGFRSAVHPCTPSLAEQQQDRGDERTGMTDTHPPDEVGNIPAPAHRLVQVPLTYPEDHFMRYGYDPEDEKRYGHEESDPPQSGGRSFDRTYNILRDLVIVLVA